MFKKHEDKVLNKGLRYVDGYIKVVDKIRLGYQSSRGRCYNKTIKYLNLYYIVIMNILDDLFIKKK